MSVYDLLDLLMEDDKVRVYDLTAQKEIFCGYASEAMDEFGHYEVATFDLDRNEDAILCVNIETEEGE